MTEENNDVNNVQPVTEPDVNQEAVQPEGENAASPAAETTPFHEDPRIQEYIERQVAQKTEPMQAQLNQYQQAALAQQQPQQQVSQDAQIETYLRNMGIDPEYATPVQMTKAFVDIQKTAMQQMNNQMQQQQLMSRHPDFNNVVGASQAWSGGQIMYAQPLQNYLSRHPEMTQSIQQQLANPAGQEMVYQLVSNDPEYRKQQIAKNPAQAQNLQQQAVNTISQVNQMPSIGQAPGGSQTDVVQKYQAMSQEEIMKEADRVMQGG